MNDEVPDLHHSSLIIHHLQSGTTKPRAHAPAAKKRKAAGRYATPAAIDVA
jgi:hypothetical protein